MSEADVLQESSGMPLEVLDEQLRRLGLLNPKQLPGLPAVSLRGQPQSQETTSQDAQIAANLPARPALPAVSLLGNRSVSAPPAAQPTLPVVRLAGTPSASVEPAATSAPRRPNTPAVSLMGGAARPDLPAPIEQLKKENIFQAPAVSLSGAGNGTQATAPQSANSAGNVAAMFAASRLNGGAGATGAPAVRPVPTAEDELRDLLNQEPKRGDFPAQKMAVWKKLLGAIAATASGIKNPQLAGENAQNIFGSPERKAEEKFNQAHTQWENNIGKFMKAAQLHHTSLEDQNLQSEIDARNQPGAEHAKLADLYADAVRKAAQEGRDPLQDPDVKRYGDAIQNIQHEPGGRGGGDTENTPFKLWRQQHPNDDVKEYFKLQPETRSETRTPKDQPHLTPGQKSSLARRYKDSLTGIEEEFRARQSGTFVDKRSGELLPPMTQEELNRRKQDAEDDYKDELEAAGETVTRYRYGSENANAGAAQNAANAGTQHQVGDEVTYKGRQYRIAGIKNGKAQLAPVGANQ